jgi:predicted NBD/HSP70 family sugar kinase
MTGELGHVPVLDNDRICGCGAKGCLETLVSRQGLFLSMQESLGKRAAANRYSWDAVQQHVAEHGLEPWLKRTLQISGASIAGAMNILGLSSAVVTGVLSDLTDDVRVYLGGEIRRAAMWGKFGDVSVTFAPRRRMRGLVSVGIDRLLVDAAAAD